MEEKNLKEVSLKTLNGFEKVDSVVCIVSGDKKVSTLIASEDKEDLQNMLVSTMIKDPAVHALFMGAVMAAELFKGEEE